MAKIPSKECTLPDAETAGRLAKNVPAHHGRYVSMQKARENGSS